MSEIEIFASLALVLDTEDDVRFITEGVKRVIDKLPEVLTRIHDAKAYKLLGYSKWEDYVNTEFGIGRETARKLMKGIREFETPMIVNLTEGIKTANSERFLESPDSSVPEIVEISDSDSAKVIDAEIVTVLAEAPRERLLSEDDSDDVVVRKIMRLFVNEMNSVGMPFPRQMDILYHLATTAALTRRSLMDAPQ